MLQAYVGLPPSRSAAAPFAGGFDADDINPVTMPEGVPHDPGVTCMPAPNASTLEHTQNQAVPGLPSAVKDTSIALQFLSHN